jgi:SAM-dependent methyltransferase
MKAEKIKRAVRDNYGKVAKRNQSCSPSERPCCEGVTVSGDTSKRMGYSEEELKTLPEGANLGLGCGNPVAFASLAEGETVLDLGSGPGLDCFLAAQRVGPVGRVIGVDMTSEMVEKARENAKKGEYTNVEFKLGEIEDLPVVDNSVDVILSNCVINLVPDKKKAFSEAFRVLKPGGRLMVSDIVLLNELPDFVKNSVEAYVGCLSGALPKDEYIKTIREAGFEDITIVDESAFPLDCMTNDPTGTVIIEDRRISREEVKNIEKSIASVRISGVKPNEIG